MKLNVVMWMGLLLGNMAFAQGDYFYNHGEKIPLIPIENHRVVFHENDDMPKSSNVIRKGLLTNGRYFSIQEVNQGVKSLRNDQLLQKAGNDTIILLDRFILKATSEDFNGNILPYIQENGAFVVDTLLYQVYVVQTKTIGSALELANYVYERGWAIWSQPDYISLTTKLDSWANQYYISRVYDNQNRLNVEIDKVWKITKGCSDIKVAVIDWGVEHHPDLRDGRGNSRVLPGLDFFPDYALQSAHGTACAGIIAASHTENMRGIAPNIKIVPVRIGVEGTSYISEAEIAEAIRWAFDDGGADVLSNSWSSKSVSEGIREAIEQAQIYGRGGDWRTGKAGLGCIVVFSSGNYGSGLNMVNPCSRYAISVGAITKDGLLADYSQTGAELDLVAFGGPEKGDIYTLDLSGSAGYASGNYTSSFNGTSAACPQVSGICALILSVNPNLTREEVEEILYANTLDLGEPGRDNTYGHGLVNAFDAVMDAVRTLSSVDLEVKSGQIVKLESDIDFMPVSGGRGLAPMAYKADMYRLSLSVPYITDWTWMEGDGVSSATQSNEQTYLGVEHSGGNTLLTTYYFYVKSTRFGQAINRWYPVDPTAGNKFLVRKIRPSILNLNNVIQSGERYEAAATTGINLLPGFEVKQGGSFVTDIAPDVDENAIFNCQ